MRKRCEALEAGHVAPPVGHAGHRQVQAAAYGRRQALALVEGRLGVSAPDRWRHRLSAAPTGAYEVQVITRPLPLHQLVGGLGAQHRVLVVHLVAAPPIEQHGVSGDVFAKIVHPAVVAEVQGALQQALEPGHRLGVREVDRRQAKLLAGDEFRKERIRVGRLDE